MVVLNRLKARFFLLFFILILSAYAKTIVKISIPQNEYISDPTFTRNSYYIELLKLTLDKTINKYGNYEIENTVKDSLQGRLLFCLAKGCDDVDVMWSMTNIEREKGSLPVRIPLLKGLMGCRLLIINKDKSLFFSKITNVKEIKKLTAVQGNDWPDTDILIANGFKVVTNPSYEGMFNMVDSGRVDYFPRAINEPYDEIKLRPRLNLMVDEKIILYYFSPNFFFVNINKPELRDRLEEGLKIAIADGSFDKLFYNHPSNKEILKKIDFKKMKIFKLDNPFLTEETKKLMNKKEYILKMD